MTSWGRNQNHFTRDIKCIKSDLEHLLVGPVISPSEAQKANDLQRTMENIMLKEEVFWKQRSRANWLKAGDKNTKYFHNRASTRKRTNFIKSLTLDDNSKVTSLNDITNSFVQFYSDLFASQVKKALFQLAGDKAPGPDGLNPSFFQKNWDSAGIDLCSAALYALNTNGDLAPINDTTLVLIPKVKNASRIKDYRPISLCSTFYKVVSKTIANRLKSIIPDLISHNQGYIYCRSAPSISHLLFADDSFLFTGVSTSSCSEIKDILLIYQQATGQSVNLHKSSILFSPNTSSLDRDIFRDSLNMDNKPFIDKYLGVPQYFSRSKKPSFIFLLQKASSKLSTWNQNLFSRAGKEILLKSVIQAIPSYAMSCFRIPVSICRHFSGLMSKFWWGSLGHKHKIHWKKWDNLCTSKFFGGLGFRNIVHHNQAMLAKQAWRIFTSPDSLVALLLKAKYFKRNDFWHAPVGHSPSFCRRSILWGRELLVKGLIWKIGDDTSVNISESNWLSLRESVIFKPGLSPPSPTVSFFITEDRHWDITKLKLYFDEGMCNSILSVLIDPCHNDCLIWNYHPSGCFTVNSAYHLANSNSSALGFSNPAVYKPWWSSVWSSNIPPKIKHFEYRDAQSLISSPFPPIQLITTNSQVPNNMFQLSVDAALSPTSTKHGYGAVVTDIQGNIVAGFSVPSTSGLPPIFAEAEALNRALLWCQAVQFPLRSIVSDCLTLVRRLQKHSLDRSALSGFIATIASSLSSFPGASIGFIPRTENTIVHNLARATLGTDEEMVWNNLSSFL
uniref:RNase H type-1 domain-containing protein n=1 Tax=Cannabis sativa TaxID=3483 RepID=A0A803Q7V4_CANSA